ncbi:Nuclear cap-binding protein subunit 1 [Malassezia pachydermatis]
MATEQPHKTALTAALIGQLALAPTQAPPSSGDNGGAGLSLGMRVMDHLANMFVQDIDAHYWRNVRLSLHVFAALIPLGIVSPASVRAALQALVDVLASDGVSRTVADAAADCVIETVCRAGADLLQPEQTPTDAPGHAKEQLDAIVRGIRAYADRREAPSTLLSPFSLAHDEGEYAFLNEEGWVDRVHALEAMQEYGYVRPGFLPSASHLLPTTVSSITSTVPLEQRTIRLPEIHVSPIRSAKYDDQDDDLLAPPPHLNTGKGMADVVRARIGAPTPECAARWMGDSVPQLGRANGLVLRAIVQDVLDLYVVNRKECAHVLLALPQWLRRGTFDGRVPPTRGVFGESDSEWLATQGDGPWSLEDVLLECVLSTALLFPRPPQLELYYSSLLREIVTLAPQQVAPSIGRTIRRLYSACAEGRVHADVLRRVADWFSMHLSNFNFTWAWTEWADDAALPWSHPRRALARRVVELEVRLAYYDRIKSTLPPELESSLLPPWEPAPVYLYGDPSHAHHALAMQFFNSLKAKASVQVVQADLQSFQQRILAPPSDVPSLDETHVETPAEAEQVVRDMAVQTLLNAGSRSFSHLLNVIERYHELLRALSQTPEARVSILASTAAFWTRSPQWVLIVCDKLLQYRIVEPVDVVTFVFSTPEATEADDEAGSAFALATPSAVWGSTSRDWSSFHWWAMLRLTVDKVLGRVGQLARRVEELKRASSTETTASADPTSHSVSSSDAPPRAAASSVDEAQVHLDAIQLEQRKVLVTILTQMVALLHARGLPTLDAHASADAWQTWWLHEWYRAFLGVYAPVLAAHREILLANVFAKTANDDPALTLFEQATTWAASLAL